jgi:hypothetical protein
VAGHAVEKGAEGWIVKKGPGLIKTLCMIIFGIFPKAGSPGEGFGLFLSGEGEDTGLESRGGR